jgi:hypothetical protein
MPLSMSRCLRNLRTPQVGNQRICFIGLAQRFFGSCPKSVIDDKHFRSNELWFGGRREISPTAGDRAVSGNSKQPVW